MACRAAFVIALGLCASGAMADFDPDAYPRHETCALCHGLFGTSHTAKFPNLGGQDPSYLTAQLQAFLSGDRTNDGGQMAAIVLELQAGDLERVVDWFSSQSPPDPYDNGDTTEGQSLYATLACAACHNSADLTPGAPHLTAQHAGYLVKQMADFSSGARIGLTGVDHGALLPEDPELRTAIARYLSSQPRQ